VKSIKTEPKHRHRRFEGCEEKDGRRVMVMLATEEEGCCGTKMRQALLQLTLQAQ